MILYALALALFAVGLYGLLVKKNLIKIVMSVAFMKFSADLLFILFGYRKDGAPPFAVQGAPARALVDPLPQAFVLVSLIVGFALLAVMVALAIQMREKYGTFDSSKIRNLKG